MSSIKICIDEIDKLKAEIKRNRETNMYLRKRIKELEANIINYLQENDHPGIKYKGRAIILENKEKFTRKGRKSKEHDVVNFLYKLGLNNPESIYEELQRLQKGNPVLKQQIKFKKI